MRKYLLLLLFFVHCSIAFSDDKKYSIRELNISPIRIGNDELIEGDRFAENDIIFWASDKQAMLVSDDDGRKYLFEASAFEQARVNTIKRYIAFGDLSSRGTVLPVKREGTNKIEYESRIAFVIGNSNYVNSFDFLKNPIQDAKDVSDMLVQLGFDTYTMYDINSEKQFKAIQEYANKAQYYDVVLFYYAGHGFSYNKENYYMPIDVSNIDAASIHKCLSFTEIANNLTTENRKATIIMLDACRNQTSFRGVEGIAPIEAPASIVLYSTSNGNQADDGKKTRNSPFASAVLNSIEEPGQPLIYVADNIKRKVRELTDSFQTPCFYDNTNEDFFFVPINEHEESILVDNEQYNQTSTIVTKKNNTSSKYNQSRMDIEEKQYNQWDLKSASKIIALNASTYSQPSFGLTFGMVNYWGGYIKVRSNFCFTKATLTCNKRGQVEGGGYIWTEGETRISRSVITAGGIYRANKRLFPYFGLGYGQRLYCWKTFDEKWAKVSDSSCAGISFDAGTLLKFGNMVLSAGFTNTSFKLTEPEIGLGIVF